MNGDPMQKKGRIALIEAGKREEGYITQRLSSQGWDVITQGVENESFRESDLRHRSEAGTDVAILQEVLRGNEFQKILNVASEKTSQLILAHKTLPPMSDPEALRRTLAFGRPYKIANPAELEFFLNQVCSNLPSSSQDSEPGRFAPGAQKNLKSVNIGNERPILGNINPNGFKYIPPHLRNSSSNQSSPSASEYARNLGRANFSQQSYIPGLQIDEPIPGLGTQIENGTKNEKKGKKGGKKGKQNAPHNQRKDHDGQTDFKGKHNKSNPKGKFQPFKRKSQPGDIASPDVKLDESLTELGKSIILFDLNGTLTSHTAQRQSAGSNKMRPGTHHLRRLQDHFKLGIWSSATDFTVQTVVPMLEKAAGQGPPIFQYPELILHRGHTELAPSHHIENGGKEWDTVKPLSKFFKCMNRVFLVDDDEFKAYVGERDNLVLIPCWQENQDDTGIESLVTSILSTLDGLSEETDIREYSRAISEGVFALSGGVKSDKNHEEICIEDDIDLDEVIEDLSEKNENQILSPQEVLCK